MKKTTKLLSVILALIMCLGILPMSAFAANAVQDVEIFVSPPPKVSGWVHRSFNYTANYSYDLEPQSNGDCGYWSETDTKPTTFSDVLKGKRLDIDNGDRMFKGNKYYTFVTVVKARTNYEFSNSSKVTVNGKTASYANYNGTNKYRYVWYCFGKTDPATLKGIEIVSSPTTTQYIYKSNVSTEGLKVIGRYSDETEADITNKVTISGFSAQQKPGDYYAVVSCEGLTDDFHYTVSYAWWQWVIRIVLLGFIWY